MSPLELRTLRRAMLEKLEDYEGDTSQLSCLIPSTINDALKDLADAFDSPKITKSQVVSWALIRFVEESRITRMIGVPSP